MSARAVIDSVDFAQAARELHGTVPLLGLLRLQDSLVHDADARLRYVLRGGSDAQGRLFLSIEIKGMLTLRCQRCLEKMAYPLELANTLRLMRQAEVRMPEDDDPLAPECIDALHELDIVELIEEEVLLALPYAPRHEDAACRVTLQADRETVRSHAFAPLAGLNKLKS
jgi:uncharacterized protein